MDKETRQARKEGILARFDEAGQVLFGGRVHTDREELEAAIDAEAVAPKKGEGPQDLLQRTQTALFETQLALKKALAPKGVDAPISDKKGLTNETTPDLSAGTAVYRSLGAPPGESHAGGLWLTPGDFRLFLEAGGDDNPQQVREVLVGSWREFDDQNDFELSEGSFLDQAGWEEHVGAAQQEAWALRQQVGTLPEDASPDELKPRGESWLAERAGWIAEVAKHQSEVATLQAANLALEEKVASLEAALKAKTKSKKADVEPEGVGEN